jgi:hypothetical protein
MRRVIDGKDEPFSGIFSASHTCIEGKTQKTAATIVKNIFLIISSSSHSSIFHFIFYFRALAGLCQGINCLASFSFSCPVGGYESSADLNTVEYIIRPENIS